MHQQGNLHLPPFPLPVILSLIFLTACTHRSTFLHQPFAQLFNRYCRRFWKIFRTVETDRLIRNLRKNGASRNSRSQRSRGCAEASPTQPRVTVRVTASRAGPLLAGKHDPKAACKEQLMTVVIVDPRGIATVRSSRTSRHFLLSHRQIQSRCTVAGGCGCRGV